MTVILIACGAFLATLAGGALALRFRDQLHLILGFSAGAVLGVGLFDLLPEAFDLGAQSHDTSTVVLCFALGILGYFILDRVIFLHAHADESGEADQSRGAFGAGTLSAHSLLDGVGIGLAYQVSPAIGLVVAAAVLAHDFSDGLNTVNFVLRHGGSWRTALRWLVVDAVAPVVGAAATLLVHFPEADFGRVLAAFGGFFLYLGLSNLIPESQHRHPKAITALMTLLGATFLWVVIHLAGG